MGFVLITIGWKS